MESYTDNESSPRQQIAARCSTYFDDINHLRNILAKQSTYVDYEKPEKKEKQVVLDKETESYEAEHEYSSPYYTEDVSQSDAASQNAVEEWMEDSAEDICTCGKQQELKKVSSERDQLLSRIRKGEVSKTSLEERVELERALDGAKAMLFQEKKLYLKQIDGLEEKLEHSQCVFDETLAEKDDVIANLQWTIDDLRAHKSNETLEHHQSVFDERLAEKDDVIANLQWTIDDLRAQKSNEEENVSSEVEKWKQKASEVEHLLSQTEKRHKKQIAELSALNQQLASENEEKCNKLKDVSKSMESQMQSVSELSEALEAQKKLNSALITNSNAIQDNYECIINKNEYLKQEMNQLLVKAREEMLKDEQKDQKVVSGILDECDKLLHLQNCLATKSSSGVNLPKKGCTGLEAVSGLKELVDGVSKLSLSLVDDLNEAKRRNRKLAQKELLANKLPAFQTRNERILPQEEPPQVRPRIGSGVDYWKEMTAQHLAKKLGEEYILQLDRKLFQDSISPYDQPTAPPKTSYSSSPSSGGSNSGHGSNSSSTLKLLCHLQSRVNQLKYENKIMKPEDPFKS